MTAAGHVAEREGVAGRRWRPCAGVWHRRLLRESCCGPELTVTVQSQVPRLATAYGEESDPKTQELEPPPLSPASLTTWQHAERGGPLDPAACQSRAKARGSSPRPLPENSARLTATSSRRKPRARKSGRCQELCQKGRRGTAGQRQVSSTPRVGSNLAVGQRVRAGLGDLGRPPSACPSGNGSTVVAPVSPKCPGSRPNCARPRRDGLARPVVAPAWHGLCPSVQAGKRDRETGKV